MPAAGRCSGCYRSREEGCVTDCGVRRIPMGCNVYTEPSRRTRILARRMRTKRLLSTSNSTCRRRCPRMTGSLLQTDVRSYWNRTGKQTQARDTEGRLGRSAAENAALKPKELAGPIILLKKHTIRRPAKRLNSEEAGSHNSFALIITGIIYFMLRYT